MTNNVRGEEYTKQRFVAVLDIMGFKKIVESNQASVVYSTLKNIYDMAIETQMPYRRYSLIDHIRQMLDCSQQSF